MKRIREIKKEVELAFCQGHGHTLQFSAHDMQYLLYRLSELEHEIDYLKREQNESVARSESNSTN